MVSSFRSAALAAGIMMVSHPAKGKPSARLFGAPMALAIPIALHLRPAAAYFHLAPAATAILGEIEEQPAAMLAGAFAHPLAPGRDQKLGRRARDGPERSAQRRPFARPRLPAPAIT